MRTSVQRWLLVLASAFAGILAAFPASPAWASLFGNDNAEKTAKPDPVATSTPTPTPTPSKTKAAPKAVKGKMKDGKYTGGSFSAGSYGTVKVKITVAGGEITKVETPSLPSRDRESQRINNQAGPYLRDQALAAQSVNIAGVGGASYTTSAFKKSLQDAINKSKK